MKLVFLSDIHLKSCREPSARRLLAFLDQLIKDKQTTHLFLLGDIFDLWVGTGEVFYHHFYPVVARCVELQKLGAEIHYFEGNHDFHLSTIFGAELGFRIHTRPQVFELDGLRLRVEHGDQMDPNDKGYHFLRWLWRTPPVTWLAYHLPSWMISGLGHWLSRRSREYTSSVKTIDETRARKIIREHAKQVMPDDHVQVLVAGHVHLKEDHTFVEQGISYRVFNLGSWFDDPAALVIEGGQPQWVFFK